MTVSNQNLHLKKEIQQTDINFSNFAQENGLAKAFQEYCADQIIHISGSGTPTTSKMALVNKMKKFEELHSMKWAPSMVTVSNDGTTGVTKGEYQLFQRNQKGIFIKVDDSDYLTIWQKDTSGNWKAIYDMDGGIFLSNDNMP